MKIINCYSPNFDKKKRLLKAIKFIVIHYTGMQSERESLARLCNPKSKVSSHFLINKNGKVYRLVKDNKIAWHAGKSSWGKYKNLNKNSIGIELVNEGHKFGYKNYKKKQLLSLIKVSKKIIKKYKINKKYIVGHSDIAPLRKIDPGEKFPWKYLSKKKIGYWHNISKLKNYNFNKVNFRRLFFMNLYKIGYRYFDVKKPLRNDLKVVKAFQRRFRQKKVNGLVDQECFRISHYLANSLKN